MIDSATLTSNHTSLFYSSKEEYLNIVVPYFAAGLENDEFCLWILPEFLNQKTAIMYLNKVAANLDLYIQKEQISIRGHRDFYLIDGLFVISRMMDEINQLEALMLQNNFQGIRIAGDGTWARESQWPSFMLYEQTVNDIVDAHKIKALCTYSLDKLDVKNIHEIGERHKSSLVKRMGNWDRLGPERFKR